MLGAAEWIQGLGPVRALRVSSYTYPLVSAAHVAALGLLFGAIAVVDASVVRRGRLDLARHLGAIRTALGGFAGAAVTLSSANCAG